jgi:hypothetical protein
MSALKQAVLRAAAKPQPDRLASQEPHAPNALAAKKAQLVPAGAVRGLETATTFASGCGAAANQLLALRRRFRPGKHTNAQRTRFEAVDVEDAHASLAAWRGSAAGTTGIEPGVGRCKMGKLHCITACVTQRCSCLTWDVLCPGAWGTGVARAQRSAWQRGAVGCVPAAAGEWTSRLEADLMAVCGEAGLHARQQSPAVVDAASKGLIACNPGVLLSQVVN